MEKKYTVLLAEDEREIRENIHIFLEYKGYHTLLVKNGYEARDVISEIQPDVIVADLRMPGMDGMQLLDSLEKDKVNIPIIMITAYGTMPDAIEALKRGASDFLSKPIDLDYMSKVIQKVIEHNELQTRVKEQQEQMSCIVNSAMDAIISWDEDDSIIQMNPAAQKVFHCKMHEVIGGKISHLFTKESHNKLQSVIKKKDSLCERSHYLWIPGGLTGVQLNGVEFPAEATLSCFEMRGQIFNTIILRNIYQRLQAEETIRSLTHETQYLREEINLLNNYDEILGKSREILKVLRIIEQVAVTDTSVLILGETGTGKELIARAIHKASKRKTKPLVKVNCPAIPTSLIESEFFGHEQGAFTGATKKRDGRFTLADKGTLFLDEIGELSLDIQSKLLRVLQEGEFEPVGSSDTRKVNVRIIAATNRNLVEEVKNGNFREDLYYRLNVFPILVPPLRERREDIPMLAFHFAKTYSQINGLPAPSFTPEAFIALSSYDWPGNIRELHNVIERAIILSPNGKIQIEQALPCNINNKQNTVDIESSDFALKIRTAREIQEIEQANIILALESTGWQVSGENGAAQLLGMNPSTLSSRIKALNIHRPK